MHPTPPIVTAVQPVPMPGAPPPTIPDEPVGRVPEDEPPFDVDGDRRARRRAFFARALGVLGILLTAAFAFVTVGRAWLRSLPSVVWPASLLAPERPSLPEPLGPKDEPVLPPAPIEPTLSPPAEAAPPAPAMTAAPTSPPSLEPSAPAAAPRKEPPRSERPRSPENRKRIAPADRAVPPAEPTPDRGMTPEELPAPPTADPGAPESPPAGEAPQIPADEGNTIFGAD